MICSGGPPPSQHLTARSWCPRSLASPFWRPNFVLKTWRSGHQTFSIKGWGGPKRKLAANNKERNSVNSRGLNEIRNMGVLSGTACPLLAGEPAPGWNSSALPCPTARCPLPPVGLPTLPPDPTLALAPDSRFSRNETNIDHMQWERH